MIASRVPFASAASAAVVVALAASALAGACDYPSKIADHGNPYAFLKPDPPAVVADTRTTWHKDVRAIVAANCVRCHNTAGVAPMSLETYAATVDYQTEMAAYVESRYMPLYRFDEACHALATTRRLSDADIATILAWRDDGFPEGKEADYVAPTAPAAFTPQGEAEVDLARAATYTPSGDEARCFLLPQEVLADVTLDARGWWVTDIRLNPDKTDEVQQAILYMVSADDAGALATGADGYKCDYGAGTAGSQGEVALYSWVPGKAPLSFAQETALLVPNGARFVLRIRYHAAQLATPLADKTTATLWRYGGKRTPNDGQVRMITVDAHGSDAVERFLSSSQSIVAVAPEMASGGKSFLLEYMTGPVGTCMAKSAAWDERFPETLSFAPGNYTGARLGNRTRLTCTYDDGTPVADEDCRATLVGTFPRYDSIQPLGQTCSGVAECLLSCSGSQTCLEDCVAWESPACGECARAQLFDTCAQSSDDYGTFAACESAHCAAGDSYADWLACMEESCKTDLDIIADALETEIPKGTCNRPQEACVYFPVQSP